jgi:arylsulfatase
VSVANDNAQKYNVALITIDSLRKDFVGCYHNGGQRESLTPNLDTFSDGAIVFLDAVAQGGKTKTAFPPLFTSTFSSRFAKDDPSFLSLPFPLRNRTIAELLKDSGYQTGAFHSNPYLSGSYNYAKGFDVFEDNLPLWKENTLREKLAFLGNKIRRFLVDPYTNCERINEQVFSWLSSAREPHFLWVHYMDTHGPYVSKKGWTLRNRIKSSTLWFRALHQSESISEGDREYLIDSYMEEIRYADSALGRLLAQIDFDKTIVVVLADHGDLLGEKGKYGHQNDLYEPLINVPFIMRLPMTLGIGGKRVERPVRCMDLLPSLMEMLRIEINHEIDGKSFL